LNALGDGYKLQGDRLELEASDADDDSKAELRKQAPDNWTTASDWFRRAATVRDKLKSL